VSVVRGHFLIEAMVLLASIIILSSLFIAPIYKILLYMGNNLLQNSAQWH